MRSRVRADEPASGRLCGRHHEGRQRAARGSGRDPQPGRSARAHAQRAATDARGTTEEGVMGVWGEGPFDHDSAGDLIASLAKPIRKLLEAAELDARSPVKPPTKAKIAAAK